MTDGYVTASALEAAVLKGCNRVVQQLNDSIGGRLDETNEQLRRLNGRVGRIERWVSSATVKVKNLERQVFGRRSSDREAEPTAERTAITRRDVAMVVAGVAGTVAVLTFFTKLVPMIAKAVVP